MRHVTADSPVVSRSKTTNRASPNRGSARPSASATVPPLQTTRLSPAVTSASSEHARPSEIVEVANSDRAASTADSAPRSSSVSIRRSSESSASCMMQIKANICSIRQEWIPPMPLLAVVSGSPGSGTTTLAHLLAGAIPCPAVCCDELKEGLVHGSIDYEPAPGDALAYRTLDVFFGVIEYLIDSGVAVVAEAAFQHTLWEPGLRVLLEKADVRVVQCRVDPAIARQRFLRRAAEIEARRSAHGDDVPPESIERFEPVTLPVPTLAVDTSDGYRPSV